MALFVSGHKDVTGAPPKLRTATTFAIGDAGLEPRTPVSPKVKWVDTGEAMEASGVDCRLGYPPSDPRVYLLFDVATLIGGTLSMALDCGA